MRKTDAEDDLPAPGDGQAGHGVVQALPFTQRPGFLVRRLHQINIAQFAANCGSFGVTPVQYSLLIALAVRKSSDQTTLADDLVLDRTTTAGALQRLQKRGLIRREPSKRDRRARQCRLTAKGARLLEQIEPAAQAVAAKALFPLSDAEKSLFLSLISRVLEAQTKEDPVPQRRPRPALQTETTAN